MAIVSAAAVIVAAVVIVLAGPAIRGGQAAELTVPPTSYSADLVDGETVGAATAPVVIQLYSDFQCPACHQFITEQLPRLLTDFVRPGIVRIEAKDIDVIGHGSPDESLELAVGARCAADQGRYWTFHDYVFWNQGRENRGDHNAAFIARVADAAGLDRTAWDACIARTDVHLAIKNQTATAASAGIASTPTLVINGRKAVGVPDYDQLSLLIRQLAAAASSSPSSSASSAP